MNRAITDGAGGPRVTKVVVAVDPVFAINPTGLKAQMIGAPGDVLPSWLGRNTRAL